MLYGINLELNFMVTFSCIMRLFKYLWTDNWMCAKEMKNKINDTHTDPVQYYKIQTKFDWSNLSNDRQK